jgi:hypothetical protein
MDIVNWDFLKKGLLIRNTLENPDDLVLVAANTTYKKRGDLFQTYAIPASSLGGGGGGGVSLVNTAGLISGGPISTTGTITTSMATNRLVGRYAAGSGIMQEISLGAGLTLSGAGVLSAATGPVTSVSLETNNVVNADQTILDLTSGDGIDVAYSAGGTVTFSLASSGTSLKSVVLQNDVPITTGSIVPGDLMDVTGLSFPVVSGKTYAFRFKAFFNVPNSAVGFSVSINGPTASLLAFTSGATNNASTAGFAPYNIVYATTYDQLPATGGGASTFAGINYAFLEGIVTPSANGTIVFRAKKDSPLGTLICTAKKGSYVEYSEVA